MIIYGTLAHAWYLTEITTVFLVGAIVVGIVARYNPNKIAKTMVTGAGKMVSGALIIGVARVLFDRWFKFIYPLVLKVVAVGWIFIVIAVLIGY